MTIYPYIWECSERTIKNKFSAHAECEQYFSRFSVGIPYLVKCSPGTKKFINTEHGYPDKSRHGDHPTNGPGPSRVRPIMGRVSPVSPVVDQDKLWRR